MYLKSLPAFSSLWFLGFGLILAQYPLVAQNGHPDNLGSGLRELVDAHRSGRLTGLDLRHSRLAFNPATRRSVLAYGSRTPVLADPQSRVMVRILLDGSLPMSQVRSQARTLGFALATSDAAWRQGAMEGYIPLDQADAISQLPGVAAVNLLHAPLRNAGAVTSQGASVIHSDQANQNGITGAGITIGVLSDTFNMSGVDPDAFADVTSGDLPNIGVPDGRPGLKFLSEGQDSLGGATDEGRGVTQIAYDIAPNASFCFATAVLGPLAFASNIRRLRTDSQCFADILVDDISYPDEPVFSDGPIAQAIDDVSTSVTLAGKPVAYFSAAGNGAGSVYSSNLRIVADTDARALSATDQKVDLTQIPTSIDTSGGFHNFNPDPNGPPIISQTVTVSFDDPQDVSTFFLQWDDPFDVRGGITTDLNLLVFDSSGKFIAASSSSDNNFSTLEPIEEASINGNFTVRFVIARTGRGSHLASRIFWSTDTFGELTADFLSPSSPAVFGHPGSKNAMAVGAYIYDNGLVSGQNTPELEFYSSPGPVTICCDASGKRLAAPEIRQKPEICGVDGVSTTFFGNPDLFDSFSTFFGTSAAAPHAAGVAALLLQAAGGPGSLSPAQVRSQLIASTGPHDLDPNFSQAVLGDGNTVVQLTATGSESPDALTDPKFFKLQFTSPTAGQTLNTLVIDLGPTHLYFNTNKSNGYRMTTGASTNGVQVTSTVSGAGSTVLTLNISGLQSGGFLQFGIGRAQTATKSDGVSADLLAGATVTATLANPAATLNGTIVNNIGSGYSPVDGWGLIDAVKALAAK